MTETFNRAETGHSAQWFKSSRSNGNGGNCIECLYIDTVSVRDTKDREGGTLVFPRSAWRTFVEGIRHGEFDR